LGQIYNLNVGGKVEEKIIYEGGKREGGRSKKWVGENEE